MNLWEELCIKILMKSHDFMWRVMYQFIKSRNFFVSMKSRNFMWGNMYYNILWKIKISFEIYDMIRQEDMTRKYACIIMYEVWLLIYVMAYVMIQRRYHMLRSILYGQDLYAGSTPNMSFLSMGSPNCSHKRNWNFLLTLTHKGQQRVMAYNNWKTSYGIS